MITKAQPFIAIILKLSNKSIVCVSFCIPLQALNCCTEWNRLFLVTVNMLQWSLLVAQLLKALSVLLPNPGKPPALNAPMQSAQLPTLLRVCLCVCLCVNVRVFVSPCSLSRGCRVFIRLQLSKLRRPTVHVFNSSHDCSGIYNLVTSSFQTLSLCKYVFVQDRTIDI